jgi:tetratricopeptide (TPR) repeat protein
MCKWLAATAFVLICGSHPPAAAQGLISCEPNSNADLVVSRWTKAMQTDKLSDSDRFLAFNNRAVAYLAKGDYDHAISDFSEQIKLRPDAEAFTDRGRAYAQKKEYDQAIADCNMATKLDPDFGPAYVVRADAYRSKRDRQRALAEYRIAALKLMGHHPLHVIVEHRIRELEVIPALR